MTPTPVLLRRLKRADLPAALKIQSETYPAFLLEGEEAFASRLDVAAPYCLAAIREEGLVGYLLAHGWPHRSPPEIGASLSRTAPGEVLFIHDLAVGSTGRGLGIGRKLVGEAFELAARDGLQAAELIAVEGAAPYWTRLGFTQAASIAPTLASKVADYGTAARWMERRIGPIA